MQIQYTKRVLSFLMAFAMFFSMLPVQAIATETEPSEYEHITETTVPTETVVETSVPVETTPATEATQEIIPAAEETTPASEVPAETVAETTVPTEDSNLTALQAQIDDILNWYLGTTQMATADIYSAVAAMDQDTYWNALVEVDDFENSDAVLQLTEAQVLALTDINAAFSDFGSALYERRANDVSITLYDGTVTAVEGISVTASSASSGPTLSNGTVTITRKGGVLSAKTANITIANAGDKTANISFSYVFSGNGSATLTGSTISSGTYSGTLDAGATVAMTLTGNSGSKTGTLTLSDFSWTEVVADAAATVTYDSGKGSVSLGGSAVASGGSATATSGTLAAVATPANGYEFVAWINTDTNELLSTSSTATLNVPQSIKITAVFVKSDGTDTAWFKAGNYLFTDLDSATAKNSSVILMNNATLAAGNYTIPSGVTLLIPFDDAGTLYAADHKNAGGLAEGGSSAATGAFRTLTMSDGAKIIVNGAISLSAKLNATSGGKTNAGAPTGKVPYIKMQGSSNITLNNGAKLYCYGFITGSGSVTVNSGATVYESFQIRDYRGGSGSSNIGNSVFPSSQYYIQNVEVPMTFASGASLKGISAIMISYGIGTTAVYMNNISVIGNSGSLFTNEGTVTKRYDGSTDRLIVDIAGNATVGSIALDFGTMGASIDSADYVLGLNNNMTVNILSGTTTTDQRLALQPGAILTISEGAEVNLGKNLYVYDSDEWGDFVYCESISDGIEYEGTAFTSMQDTNNWAAIPVSFAPGKVKTRTWADLVDAQIDVNGTLTATSANVYTTASGASIISSKGTGSVVLTAGSDTITYQADMNSSSTLAYHNISISSAQLMNADGSYTATTGASSTAYKYCATHGVWYTGDCEQCTPACTHNWTDADCDTPKTCSDCGETEGSALGHSWGTPTYSANGDTCVANYTCTNDGTHKKAENGTHSYVDHVCSNCQHVETFTITFLNDDGTVLKSEKVAYNTLPTCATPTKAATAQYTYTFAGWTPEIASVTGEATYTATYTNTVNKYTVKFVNEDSTVLQSSILEYGATPVYSGETPTKAADTQYTYSFKDWDKTVTAVTDNVTYTATYNTATNKYTIKFVDEDGTELQSSEVAYGEIPVYNGAAPTKEGDAQYSYTFAEWTPEVTFVTGAATYKATYTEAVNKYTITFINEDGTVLQSSEVEYGTVPTYSGETPAKASTAQYTYTFDAWNVEPVAVTGDATYTATFAEATRKYTIKFVNADNTELQSSEVAYGEMPVYTGATPTKAADTQYTYTFAGWDKEIAPVNGDATYTAAYDSTVNEYTITFVNEDGTAVLQSGKVAYGTTPSYTGEAPSKESTAQYSYTFSGWTPKIVAVTGDTTYTATFSETVNKYTVKFVNADGTELKIEELEYGAMPTYDGTPTQAATAQYTYTFTGWDEAIVSVTGDATYTATYSSSVNKYTITFADEGGSVLQSGEVAYGETPAYTGEYPTKDATAQYTYSFSGWTPEIASVTGDATYTATYTSTVNKYTVTWVIGTETFKTEEVEYGSDATAPSQSMPGYTLTWDKDGKNIKEDTTITGTYAANTYTVSWKLDADTVYTTTAATYNTALTLPSPDPIKEGYTFDGWFTAAVGGTQVTEETIYAMAADGVYFAHWEAKKYAVKFVDEDGTELQSSEIAYGETPAYTGETPTKEADIQYTYTFSGWTPEIVAVSGEAIYSATFDKTVNQYTIKFVDEDGTVLQSTEVAYGETPAYTGETPTKEATAQYTYKFAGWTPEIAAVTGGATYTATYTSTVNKYTITWKNGDTVLISGQVAYGETPAYTAATPTKPATAQYTYTFSGWTPEVVEVTGEATYSAVFTETVNKYTVKFVNSDGTELQSSAVAYGETPAYTGETPTKAGNAQYSYTFSGWNKAITEVTGAVTYTAIFEQTVNWYTIKFVDEDGTVLQSTEVAYGETPAYTGETPTKEATAQYTYTFSGWTPAIVSVTGDAAYTAAYTETVNKYTVKFVNEDGTVLQTSEVAYGETPEYAGSTPTKEATDQYSYTFKGWNVEISEVTGEVTYTATFTETIKKYTIKFVNEDGTELQSTEVAYGETPAYTGETPTKAADDQYTYTFAGWTPEIAAVSGEATYKATFESKAFVAQAGEIKYTALAEAIEAAAEGGEVTLLADVTEEVTVSKAVTIVKNGFTAVIVAGEGFEVTKTDVAYVISVEVAEPVRLSAVTVGFDAEIQLSLKLFIPDYILNDGNAYITMTKDGRWGAVETKYTMADLIAEGTDSKGRYVIKAGVASGEMTRAIVTEVVDGNGNLVEIVKNSDSTSLGTAYSYSIVDYARTVFNGTNARNKKAVTALVTYGGYAQKHFGVDVDNPAYNVLSEFGIEIPSLDAVTADIIPNANSKGTTDIGITLKACTPGLDSAVYLTLKYALNAGESIDNYTFTVALPDGTSESLTPVYDSSSGRYVVTLEEIAAAYFDFEYKVTTTNNQTGEDYVSTVSILGYIKSKLSSTSTSATLVNMVKAMYQYNQAANEYFGK